VTIDRTAVTPLRRAPLVGRDAELAALTAGLDGALACRGTLFLVSGEPGIGKTRLLEEVAAQAVSRNAIAVWGRCWEGDDAPPFWPWVQVLRTLVERDEAAEVLAADAQIADQLGRVVPRTRQRRGALPAGTGGAGASPLAPADGVGVERLELLEAMSAFLRGITVRRPIVLLLDDLHAARLPSVLLLEYLLRDLPASPLLIVAAYRDTESRGALADRLGDLTRAGAAVPLRGLDASAVRAMVGALAGRAPSDRLVEVLQGATGGNPFFLDEVVRLLVAERRYDAPGVHAARLSIPERVRSAVRGRLAALSAHSAAILGLAAVIGQEFDHELLTQAAGSTPAEVFAALDEAAASGFVRRLATSTHQFTHAVFRETIYDDLTAERRASLHSRIGAALEARHPSSSDLPMSTLAHHFVRGLPESDIVRALRYVRRAGEQEFDLHAYEDAADHFEQALTLLDRGAHAGPAERAELLLALARAAVRAGDTPRAAAAVAGGAAEARRLGSVSLLAQAGLTLRVEVDGATADAARIALLEEALAALPADGAPRTAVLAQLARELRHTEDQPRRLTLSSEAITVARRLGDPALLAAALGSRCFALLGIPEHEDERIPLAAELLEVALGCGDRELTIEAYRWRVSDFLARGDLAAADREITAASELAERLRQPYYRWWCATWHASRATLAGRFAEAERLAAEAHAIGARVRPRDAAAVLSGQLWTLLWLRGDFEQIVSLMDAFRAQNETVYPELRVSMAAAFAGAGRLDDARREFDGLAAAGFQPLPQRSGSWLHVLANLAETCAILGDAPRARTLYELMRPYAGRAVLTTTGINCFGPVDRYLGMLAGTRGDWDTAESHFARSLDLCRRLAAPALTAMAQESYAAALVSRDHPEDRARARVLLDAALANAEPLGMQRIVARVALLQDRLTSRSSAPGPDNALTRDREQWIFRYRGKISRLHDRAGIAYLAALLERPHVAVPALSLLGGAAGAIERPGATERARVRVTRALRAAIEHIRSADAELGEHLAHHVRTGMECCYAPLEPMGWTVVRGG